MRFTQSIRQKSWRFLAAGVATLLTAALLSPAPAQAGEAVGDVGPLSVSQGYIAGSSTVTDDFGDEGTLRRGNSYAYTTAVALWQSILYAEGYISESGIDCSFGSGTEAATKKFQTRYGLGADGVVGTNTWSRADNRLSLVPGDSTQDLVYYTALDGTQVPFLRDKSGGIYWVRVSPYKWASAAYFKADSTCGS
ncbi:peptidoglycan-binding protein [Micromonospora phytophila]|uniref:peptidoglycan-binding domain-containing protein n=1 Tax=Micromonospora phytophila TaxID=709888 RepID=UPI00202EACB6|nr:peptidoglycan-binding protein [Micromonospora phytophila]MCM0675076.1 peptidoglycan-binding protein [Micromonospora phytophila]